MKKIMLAIIMIAICSTNAMAQRYFSLIGGETEFGQENINNGTINGTDANFFAVAIGDYSSQNNRSEIEINYRKYEGAQVTQSSTGNTGTFNLSTLGIMINSYYMFTGNKLVPYIGAGAGYAIHDIESTGGTATYALDGNGSGALAYQIGIGAQFNIDHNQSIIVGYRLFGSLTEGIGNAREIYGGIKFNIGQQY